ncbi:MAG TPA: 3'-5' exonuclease, partial [Phycisphaerae bacterium]|nr:3'-5' exonuclease [Phycisphaerae bacterium]
QDEDALANADELITAAAEYDRQHPGGDGSVAEWLQQIALVSDVDAIDETLGAVTLMTMHSAKGLEFDTVFIVGMEDGLMPHERVIMESGDVEEERRLCFVGMTRARRVLALTWSKWRELRGISDRRLKSMFLRELPKKEVKWSEVSMDDGNGYDTGGDEPDMTDVPAGETEWRQGQLVHHRRMGIGRLIWIERGGSRTRARILFERHGEKTLILEYADLEPVTEDEAGS